MERQELEAQEMDFMRVTTVDTIEKHLGFLVGAVQNGYLDPLEAFGKIKQVEKMFKDAKNEIEEQAINEAQKEDKTFEKHGFKFTSTDGRKIFNFSELSEWKEAKENLKKIEDKYKALYKLHETAETISVDESTGEVLELPIMTKTKASLSVKLK